MFAKLLVLLVAVAVALAAPSPKPAPSPQPAPQYVDYGYVAQLGATPALVSPYAAAPLTYSAAYPAAYPAAPLYFR